ncbi:DNA gyrase/topoisomerase IV subunit A, partial [Saprospiraceae bacterium]|nr:DNA gyrase/topoisomerase IV subunit A [Saprospiraceae bacterium]
FTNCEISISPNACVIVDDKPLFLTVSEILRTCTENTMKLLKMELEIRKAELEEKWHFASLEKIFIENRIYRDIEECETWEAVKIAIRDGLNKYVSTPSTSTGKGDKRIALYRDITEEDIVRLTEIKIKRISKYNSFKADELITNIVEELKEVQHHLENLVQYTIDYYLELKRKYGKGRERKTELTEFDSISARRVVANNAKLYVDRKEGFMGTGMKKDEFVQDCSDIDDVVSFRKNGGFGVYRISDKVFVGKDVTHISVWKKGDDRTTYNMLYVDGASGKTMAKRFNVKAITRDKEYDLTKGTKGTKVLYFSANPNGETESLTIQLTPGSSAKKKVFTYDFADLAIKGRGSQGNTVTKYPVKKVSVLEEGTSSHGARKFYMDPVSGRLNTAERGDYIGEFDAGDQLLLIYGSGEYMFRDLNEDIKVNVDNLAFKGKMSTDRAINALYYDGDKSKTMVKRFIIETSKADSMNRFITDSRTSKLYYVSDRPNDPVTITYKKGKEKVVEEYNLVDLIDVKGWKAIGNRLVEGKLTKVEPIEVEEEVVEVVVETAPNDESAPVDLFAQPSEDVKEEETNEDDDKKKHKPGDTIEF